jgi:hypothetical protein
MKNRERLKEIGRPRVPEPGVEPEHTAHQPMSFWEYPCRLRVLDATEKSWSSESQPIGGGSA